MSAERQAKRDRLKELKRYRRRAQTRLYQTRVDLERVRENHPGNQEKARKKDLKESEARRERIVEDFADRIQKKKHWLATHHDPKPAPNSTIGWWDGRQVAGWMVGRAPGPNGTYTNWLQKIADCGWNGQLFSGYRSPIYSQSLCYAICNQPSCPGLCAGLASNHSGLIYPRGAVDVDDWYTFNVCALRVGAPFRNNLPSDRPHRSVSGY